MSLDQLDENSYNITNWRAVVELEWNMPISIPSHVTLLAMCFFLLCLDLKRLMKYLQSMCFISHRCTWELFVEHLLSLGAFQTQCYQWSSSPRAYAFCAFSMYKELNGANCIAVWVMMSRSSSFNVDTPLNFVKHLTHLHRLWYLLSRTLFVKGINEVPRGLKVSHLPIANMILFINISNYLKWPFIYHVKLEMIVLWYYWAY